MFLNLTFAGFENIFSSQLVSYALMASQIIVREPCTLQASLRSPGLLSACPTSLVSPLLILLQNSIAALSKARS